MGGGGEGGISVGALHCHCFGERHFLLVQREVERALLLEAVAVDLGRAAVFARFQQPLELGTPEGTVLFWRHLQDHHPVLLGSISRTATTSSNSSSSSISSWLYSC
jgi:hypothetical protein